MIETIEAPANFDVAYVGPITHRCPVRDERDAGEIELTWTTASGTLECHSLGEYLAGYADVQISHEALVEAVLRELAAIPEIKHVGARARFAMAGGVNFTVIG